jgi:VanZ family protein
VRSGPLLLGWAMVAAMVIGSLYPGLHIASPQDKLVHVAAYAALVCWFSSLYPGPARALSITLVVAALGVLLELLQGLSGSRIFSFADMAANVFGATLGWILVSISRRYASRQVP